VSNAVVVVLSLLQRFGQPLPMVDREKAARALEAFLEALGRHPERDPELTGTGRRVADAFADEFLRGYDVDVQEALAANLVEASTGLVIVRGISVTTMCPHHLLPAQGVATVAFAPTKHALGLGGVVALVDTLARRLVLQEQLGEDVVEHVARAIAPRWVACRLVLAHGCMTARGERAHGASVETVAIRGTLENRDDAAIVDIVSRSP
jgi:GTP cyclohydrolase IA